MEKNDELTLEGLNIRDETGPDNGGDSIRLTSLVHKITIELTSTNYLLWRNQILRLLSQDMLDCINGSKKAPPMSITSADGTATPNQNQEYFDWWRADQFVMLLIKSSLSEEAKTIVLDCKTSVDVWTALENAFSTTSESLAHNQNWSNNLASTSSSNTSVNSTMEGMNIRDEIGPDNGGDSHMITIKLTSTNYLSWRDKFLLLLSHQDMLDYINGSKKAPPMSITSADGTATSNQNQEYFDWWNADQFVMLLIKSSLSEEDKTIALHCKTSADVWTALENAFSTTSESLAYNHNWSNNLASTSSSNTSVNSTMEGMNIRDEIGPDNGGDSHMITIKLTSTNYLSWRDKFLLLLSHQDMLDYINGSKKAPPMSITSADGTATSNQNQEYFDWWNADQFVMLLIKSSLSEEDKTIALHCKTSADVWTALENAFSTTSESLAYNHNWSNNLASTSSSNTSINSTIEDSLVNEARHELPTPNSGSLIEVRDANQILFRDKNTGKKWLLVGARNLEIKWGEKGKWTLCGDSSFSEVAEIQDVWDLDIKCTIETQMLSRETFYGAYLLFKVGKPVFGLEMVGGVLRFVDRESASDSAKRAFLLHLHQGFPVDRLIQRETGRLPIKRDDGWMEIELGVFNNGKGDGGKVEARLMEIKRLHKKGGLIVEGVEVRPKTSSTSSRRPIALSEIKPCYFVVRTSEKKCVVVGARELVIECVEAPETWLWIKPTDSRFKEVAQLKRNHWLEVKCRIETRFLTGETNYGAYLVFKLANVSKGLEKVKRVVRFVGRESGKEAAKRASAVSLHPPTTDPPALPTDCFVVSRDDGWMEVELGDFFVHHGDNDEVEARLLDTEKRYDKSGIIVEAIEFRPK